MPSACRIVPICTLVVIVAICVLHWQRSPLNLPSFSAARSLSEESPPQHSGETEFEVHGYALGTRRCSKADEDKMSKLGGGNSNASFPKHLSDCGRAAYNWLRFSKEYMKSCLQNSTQISDTCADCFVDAGQYSASNCKIECLFGTWCSSRCLSCAARYDPTMQACAGVNVPKVEQC
mmetsp:Transcript_1112/g.2445  ORF Transcript_1112/g.2445 Transcript_1112/m.2445 type:complete len:177 (-) Transcript_1112:249-779(-)